jgi:hypothetical protein
VTSKDATPHTNESGDEQLRKALRWLQEFGAKMSDQHPGFVWVERKAREALHA